MSGLFCGFPRCYRNDRHKTAPSPDTLWASLKTKRVKVSRQPKVPIKKYRQENNNKNDKLKNHYNIIVFTLLFAFTSCLQSKNENQVHTEDDKIVSNKRDNYTLNDLISFSKAKYGFVKNDGTINEYYGDFDFVSAEKSLFDFNVGCGSKGDMISIIIKTNNSKSNCFDIYIPDGDRYFGEWAS
jgi:hypothetical protein